MPGRFKIEAVIKAVDKISAPMSRMGNNVNKTFRRMSAGADRFNSKMRRMAKVSVTALGVVGVAGALFVLKSALGAVISKGAEFEQTLVGAGARFSTPIRKGTAAFREMEEAARDIGRTTEFTANQAAAGLNFLAKAGFDAETALKLIPNLVDFATASELDLARASDIASDAVGALGLMTKDTAQLQKNFSLVTDQMSRAANSANVNVEQLFQSMVKGAPAAVAAGVPMETFIALAGRLAQSGLKASDAGTAMKNIFLALVKIPVQKQLEDLGVSVKDSKGDLRDFADIMDDLNAATKDLGKADRAGLVNKLFGLRGVTGVSTILTETTVPLRAFRDALIGAVGDTGRLAAIMRDTLTNEIKEMNSAFESVALTIFAIEKGPLSGIVKKITEMTRAVDELLISHSGLVKFVFTFGAIAAAVLVLGLIIAGVVAGIGFIASSAAALIITGGLLGAAFLKWLDPITKIKEVAIFLFDQFAKIFSLVAKITGERFTNLLHFFGFNTGPDRVPDTSQEPGSVSSPNERTAGAINETVNRSTAELTVLAQTGTVELEVDGLAPGVEIRLEETGAL